LYTYQDIETLKKFGLESTQAALQLGKLDRMKEYAEGVVCRRKILLGYFGQSYRGECHNCDVCANPYQTFDGTEISHLVLQTIQDDPSLTTKNLISRLLDLNVTVGFADWHFYVGQLKNLGLIEVLFDNRQHLSLTNDGIASLDKPKKILLVSLPTFVERQEKITPSSKKTRPTSTAKKDAYNNPLFEVLRQERLKLARQKNIAAYMIFSDATLLQMATDKPQTEVEMRAISGVGSTKWNQYGEIFLKIISEN